MNEPVRELTKIFYQRAVQRVLLVTLCLNLVVVIGKLAAGMLSGSLGVISDAVHSAGDSVNNIIGLVVMRYAATQPDEGHPYGHAKFETLAAFTIAVFLLVICYEICTSAFKRLFSGSLPQPEITALTFGALIATIIINLIVATYEQRHGRRLKSEILVADAIHTRSDVLISCSVLLSLLLVRQGYFWLDPLVSFGVAAFIAWNCYQIFKMTVPALVDAAPVPSAQISKLAEGIPGVHSAYNVRSRKHGSEIFIEMHLRVDPGIEYERVASQVIAGKIASWLVKEKYGRVTSTLHVEPLSFGEPSAEQTTLVVIYDDDGGRLKLTWAKLLFQSSS